MDFKDANNANFLPSKNVDYTLDCNGCVARLTLADGTPAATATFAATANLGSTSSYPMYIFSCNCRNKVQNCYTKAQLRFFDSRKPSGDLNRKLVPWKKADNTVCLYDHVTKTFCGSGFTAGAEGDFYYTLSDETNPSAAVLELRRGTIDDPEILPLYSSVAKMGAGTTVNVPVSATTFNSLALSEGTLSFADGAATETTVNGALTLTGGATLAVDVVGDACDTFVCNSFALADATKENPAIIRVTGAAGRDWTEGVTLVAQGVGGDLSTKAIRVAHDDTTGLELGVEIADGKLSIVKVVPPVAHWTGAVGADVSNPDNWAYTNAQGSAESSLPDEDTIVYFRGSSAPDIAADALFAALRIEADLTLAADRDWRGLSASIPVSGKIDLNGRKLTVSQLAGDCEITDSTTVYERLDFIESTGTQYIDTGYQLLANDIVDACAYVPNPQPSGANSIAMLFGCSPSNGNNYYFRIRNGSYDLRYKRGSKTGDSDATASTGFYNEIVDVHAEGNTLTWTTAAGDTGSLTATGASLGNCGINCHIFNENENNSKTTFCGAARLYSFKITSGGTVKRDFVPVRHRADGVLGLLDLANLGTPNEFYANKGSGAFTAGNPTGEVIYTLSGSAEAAQPGELHVNVASGTVTGGATLTGGAVLVKDGAGTFKWNGGENSVAASCPVVVTNGVFGFDTDDDDVFGSGGTITIAGKGQMDISKRSADATNTSSPVYNRTFYIEGDGPNGKGAIVRNSANTGNLYGPHLKDVYLTGDATIGGTTRIDFRPKTGGSSMLHGEGHVLTIKNTDRVAFCGGNSGCNVDRIVVDGGFLQPCSDATGTLEVKCIELRNGGKLISWHATATATYALAIPVEVSAGSCAIGSDNGYFSIRDVEVKGGATLAVEKGSVSIAGTLSGSGAITGTGIAFGGGNSCWDIALDVNGETNKVDFSFSPVGLSKITVLCGGTEKRKVYDLAPAGELTDEQVEAIKLEVTDELTQQPLSGSYLVLDDNRLVLTVVRDSRPTVACWTGKEDDRIDNPANWVCTNVYGEAEGELPCEITAVYLKGDLRFDLTENPGWKSVTFESARLAKNCDFSGIEFPLSGVLDLNGKNLVLTETQMGSENAYEVTDTSEAGAGGALRVTVASDTTVKNTTVTLSGTLKLVKDGAGTFVAAKPSQTYAGGTEIAAGKAEFAQSGNTKSPWSANQALFGANGTTITVDAGARLNVSGTKGLRFYDFVLAGGTLSNENYEGQSYMLDDSDTGFGNVTLTDDSTLLPLRNFVFNQGVLDLGGHTLTIDFQSYGSKAVYLVGGDANKGIVEQQIKNGTIRVVGGDTAGTTSLKLAGSGRVRATGTTLHMVQAKLDMSGSNLYVGDYISEVTASKYFAGRGALYVSGTFKPVTAFFYGCTLQNGSTLDLTAQSGVWNMTSLPDSSSIKKTIYFAANTTVYVKPGSKMGKIANWTAKPENIASVTFEPAPGTVGHYELLPDVPDVLPDGLYRTAGLTIILR